MQLSWRISKTILSANYSWNSRALFNGPGELQPLRTELGEVRQAVVEQGQTVNTLAGVVGQNTTFMLKVSAANKRIGQQMLALRDQLNRELNSASRPEDQRSAVSQEDLFHDSEEYDPAYPTDTRIGEPSPPGLESPATGMQP